MPLVDYPKLFLAADNFRNNGQIDEAIKRYLQIVTLATKPADRPFLAKALHLAGVAAKANVLSETGSSFRDASNYFTEAEKVFKDLNLETKLGSLYRDWGVLCDAAKRYHEAERLFQKSLVILQKQAVAPELGIALDKYGRHFFLQNDQITAEKYMLQALKILKNEPEAGFLTATTLFDLAQLRYQQGEFVEAADLAEESLSWFAADHSERQYQYRLAQLQGFLTQNYYQLNEPKKAVAKAKAYEKIIATFDPAAAKVIESELNLH